MVLSFLIGETPMRNLLITGSDQAADKKPIPPFGLNGKI